MADYSDYYSVIARAISGLPSKTDEARHAIYERARTALQKRFDPPISETDLAIERFALEAAIQRVETESRFGDTRHGLSFISMVKHFIRSVRDKFNNNIAIRGDSLKAAFIVAALVGIFVAIFFAIFFHWMTAENSRMTAENSRMTAENSRTTAENSRESKSYSLISPSELALRDVTLSRPLSVSLGAWEIKGVVKNNSPRSLTGLWLKVTVRDCPNASLCTTIGEAIRHIVINVPPSQTRIIDEGDLFPREMFIPEKLEWSYEIVQTEAK
jgi:hypothetical protein